MKIIRKIFILLIFISGLTLGINAQNAGGNQAGNNNQGTTTQTADSTDASKDELLRGELIPEDDSANLSEEDKKRNQTIMEQEAIWKNPDFKGYDKNFQELHRLSKAFANNKFRLALSNYQSGINTVVKMRQWVEEYRKQEDEKTRLNEKWYWQTVDRKSKEDRTVARQKLYAKQEALNYFTRAINHMDEINNPDLRERSEFKRLMSDIYRAWAMMNYDLQNLPQCIPVLELYVEIDENEKEYPVHKYLASCYAFKEKLVEKYQQGTEDMLFKYRYKKNVHLLRATELKYGKDSPEYKHIVNIVNRDEVISVK